MTDTPMTPDREQEIRTLDLLELMSDRAAPVISGHLAVLLAEVDRLRTQVAELEKAACCCFAPTHHAPDCTRAHVTWQGVTYNATSWYQDRDGEWLRPHSVNADGELLMHVRGDSAYEPVPVSEIEAEYGPLVQVDEGPSDPAGGEARMCPAKHGAWGRICELRDGHDGFHSGPIPGGGVTWEGDAP